MADQQHPLLALRDLLEELTSKTHVIRTVAVPDETELAEVVARGLNRKGGPKLLPHVIDEH